MYIPLINSKGMHYTFDKIKIDIIICKYFLKVLQIIKVCDIKYI